MSKIYEHFGQTIVDSYKDPEYDKEYGDWYQSKLKELHDLDYNINVFSNPGMEAHSGELEILKEKRTRILQELNG